MRAIVSTLCFGLCVIFVSLSGCGDSTEPVAPERNALETYLDENPEAAARIDEDVEMDDEGDE